MPTVQVPAQLSVEQLKAAVQQLPPNELQAFTAWLVAWQQKHHMQGNEDAALIETTRMRLPAEDAKRLKRLIAKSERGALTPKELETYRTLAQQAEQLNARCRHLAIGIYRDARLYAEVCVPVSRTPIENNSVASMVAGVALLMK